MKTVLSVKELNELHKLLEELNSKTATLKNQFKFFYQYSSLMLKNVEICISNNYDSIDELTIYLQEDYKSIFRKEKEIENFHIPSNDINKKAEQNLKVQELLAQIDYLLETDIGEVHFLAGREWYNTNDLKNIGEEFEELKSQWMQYIDEFRKTIQCESMITEVDNDIWIYAGVALGLKDTALKNWFYEEIPAYRFLVPIEVLRLENGKNILRSFLLNTHT